MLNKKFFSVIFSLIFFLFGFNFTFAQTVTVTPAVQNVNPGQQVTVKIATSNIDKCTITGEPYNNFDIIKSGTILLRPNKTTTYIFNCKSASGVATSTQATVNIIPINSNNTNINSENNNSNNSGGSDLGLDLPNLGNSNSQNNYLGNNNASKYSNQTIQVKANELCARYSGYSSVYGDPTIGGGNGSVPVDFNNLAQVLLYIQKYQQLTANELRQQNLLKYCEEYKNMADASKRLGENAAKTITKIQQDCTADKPCLVGRVYKEALKQEIEAACKGGGLYAETICELVQKINTPKILTASEEQNKMIKYCDDYYQNEKFYPKECWLVPKAFETIVEKYYAAKDNIEYKVNETANAFNPNGVIGPRPCIKTASGRPPEEIRYYEADCIQRRDEPAIITEEALRQITALPYTQAFSPAGVLGYDGVLDNINTRTREGNLFDGNLSPTFGNNQGSGNGNTNGVTGTELAALEENYKTITRNVAVIVQLYDVAKLAYASSSSVCKNLPVTIRKETVNKIEASKLSYLNYLLDLKNKWDNAVAKPRENHSDLIVKVNFDLKDKYNQAEIDKVYDAVKKLLQTCVDAGGNTP